MITFGRMCDSSFVAFSAICVLSRAQSYAGKAEIVAFAHLSNARNRLKRVRLKSLLLHLNERYHRRSSYTSICQSLSLSRPPFLFKRVWRSYKLRWRVRANVARGKRARRGWRNKKGTVCPQHFASTCSLHSSSVYVSMTGKALHRPNALARRNANFPWRGVREPKQEVHIKNFAFWQLRHQRCRDRVSGLSQSRIIGWTASLKFICDILFNALIYSGIDFIFIDSGTIGLPSRACGKILFYNRRKYRGDSTIQENCKTLLHDILVK